MLTSENLARELENVVEATKSTELVIRITQALSLFMSPEACLSALEIPLSTSPKPGI